MSEEEKKALAYLKFYLSDIESEYFDKDFAISKKDLKIVLNLIEKQQKEIEELNNQIIELQQQKIVDKNSIKQQDNFFDYYNYIHKDKIRDEIEFLKKPREITLIDEKGNSKKVMYEEKYNDTIKILEKILEE